MTSDKVEKKIKKCRSIRMCVLKTGEKNGYPGSKVVIVTLSKALTEKKLLLYLSKTSYSFVSFVASILWSESAISGKALYVIILCDCDW